MPIDTKDQANLHQKRQDQLTRSAKYIKDFLGQLSAERDYDECHCPTCGQAPTDTLFSKNNGRYCHCSLCNHIYLANPLTQELLIEFYTGYPTSSLDWHKNESAFYRRIYEAGLDLINIPGSDIDLLDIGCSGRYFLSIASERGFRVHGLEPNKRESEEAIKQGINIIGATIDDLCDYSEFGIITLWDVLEHIRDPIDYLRRIKPYLNSSGLIFVQVPTSDSLAARVMRGACNMFDGIEHLTLFSANSLDIAFEKAGYSLINRQSVISESHVLRNYLCYERYPYLASAKPGFSPEFLSGDYIESCGLGYKIQAVYRIKS